MKRLIPLLLSLATVLALSPASNAQYYPPAGNPNAVAPSGTPATGDTVYYNGSAWVRLAHAADGTVMVLASGIPSWTALSTGIPVPSSPATGSILWYNGTGWIASLNGLFGSGVTDNGTIQLGNNTNSVSGVLVIQSGGATGQGVITYPGTANKNFIMPTVNYTGLTALPGSTLPLLISSLGVESTGALSYAQGGTGATSFTNHTLVTAGASSLGGITPGTAGHVPRSNATDYVDAQLGLSDLSGTVQAAQFPILTGDITTAGGALATTLKNTGPGVTSATNSSVTIDAQGRVTALSSGATPGNVSFGGNGADGAITISGATTIEGRVLNATTLTVNSAQLYTTPNCIINTTGVITFGAGSSTIQTRASGAAQTGTGIASAGGNGATAATSAGDAGAGPAPGEPGNNTGLIGAGGGAGAAASGGNGGGFTVASGDGAGGLNGAGTSHFSGWFNGSGGGGGGSGSGGTGGNGGGGASHLTFATVGGFSGTGSMIAIGSAGAAAGTLGSGGGGGGGGTISIYSASGNLPAMFVSVAGGAGGASAGVGANPGGGGGGYIGGTVSGTAGSPTLTVSGGLSGTGGSGTAGTAGGNGLANIIASTTPTLPNISYSEMNGNAAGKNNCWILLARKAIRGEDYESEKSHTFIWDGEKGQASAPLSYVAATYAAPGKFSELCMALHFGGDASTASLCDSSNRDQCAKMFDAFKDSPIKGEMPMVDSTCDDTEFLRPSV